MAETNNNNPETNGTGASNPTPAPERTFTQEQLDAIVQREKAKATKGWFSAEDMAAKDTSINTLTSERDEARSNLSKVQTELENFKRERILLKKGVPEEDIEYYAFKINQLVDDKKDFEHATEDFLKEHPLRTTRVDFGGQVGGNTGSKPNDKMNELIRNARK